MNISYITEDGPASVSYENLTSFDDIPDDIRNTAREISFKGTVEGGLFSRFPALERIVWEGEYDSVPAEVFHGCLSLKEILLSAQVTSIGKNAFYDCVSLEKIVVPKLKKLETAAFAFCRKLTDIDELISHLKVIPANCFLHCESITEVHFPDSMRHVYTSAFAYCRSLKTAVFNTRLQRIHEGAFQYSGLTEVLIPEKTMVYPFAFYRCNDLESVIFERKTQESNIVNIRKMYSIADFSFAECANLTRINKNAYGLANNFVIFYRCYNLSLPTRYVAVPLEQQSASLDGYFTVRKLGHSYFREYNQGRLYVNDKEEHILFQWDTKRKYNESFTASIPRLYGSKRKDLTINHYYWEALYFTFVYTLEHSGMSDEVTEHGFISNVHHGYYGHRVYLEKGEYKHIQIRPIEFDVHHRIFTDFVYSDRDDPERGKIRSCETDV